MDFLDYNDETFDKIIANPPFSKSQDVKHILHMYELLNE
jgi:16S rRNA G1207 methylase RsmC